MGRRPSSKVWARVCWTVFLIIAPITWRVEAEDWPQWCYDEHWSANSPMTLPSPLYLQWRRDDVGYLGSCRPVQLSNTVFAINSAYDRIAAYNTVTGVEKWRYYGSGALQGSPVAMALGGGTNVVIFGSNDGYVYCLNAEDGSERWKYRAAPNAKKAMGFGRLSSRWPVLGAPVAYNGRVYFVAGYLPSCGLFAYCLDVATGAVVWRNEGGMSGDGHNSSSSPLSISTDHTRIYGGGMPLTRPWAIDILNGDYAGNIPGSGEYIDGTGTVRGSMPATITVGGQTIDWSFLGPLGIYSPEAELAGDGKLFASQGGSLYCFGGNNVASNIYPNSITPLPVVNDGWTTAVSNMLSRADLKQGLALVWGVGSGRVVAELVTQAPGLMIVAADPDPVKLKTLHTTMDAAGIPATRVSTVLGNPVDCGFPPYVAALVASEDITAAGFPATGPDYDAKGIKLVRTLYKCTRPFGGEIWLPTTAPQSTALAGWVSASADLELCDVANRTTFTQIRRLGLPDSALELNPPFGVVAFGGCTILGDVQRGVWGGRDYYSWLPMTAEEIGYEPIPPDNNNAKAAAGAGPASGLMVNSLYGIVERTLNMSVGYQGSCSGTYTYGELGMQPGKLPFICNPYRWWGSLCFPEAGGCAPSCSAGNGIVTYEGIWHCACNPKMNSVTFSLAPMEDEENWVNYRGTRSNQEIQEAPIRRIGVNLGAAAERYLPDEDVLWTHNPGWGRWGEARPLVPVSYRGNAKRAYHHVGLMEPTTGTNHNFVSASQVAGMTGLSIHLTSPIVALSAAAPPVIDGTVSDGCWNGAARVEIPRVPFHRCDDTCNIQMRYDTTNLYIAGTALAQEGLGGSCYGGILYMKVALNSREMTTSTVTLICGEQTGKASSGMDAGAWQGAYYIDGARTNFTCEMAIPLSALAAVGLWKEQMVMNVEICGATMNGASSGGGSASYWNSFSGDNWQFMLSPVYLDAARGLAASPGTPHTVRLYFAEMEDKTVGQRIFDVKLQGTKVLTNLDVVSQAGAVHRELVKEFKNVLIPDKLDVDFVKTSGEPVLSGVEILRNYNAMDTDNVMPVALIDASATTGTTPLTVNFSARRSYDPDGQIVECVWETGDGRLAKNSAIQHVFAEAGTYKVNLLVLDNRGGTGTTNVTVTVSQGAPAAFVCSIRTNGGDYTTLSGWEAAMRSDLTSTQSLLFTVGNPGSYLASDDGTTVNFASGGSGTLRHINGSNIAYITGCSGTIAAGLVTCASTHSFTVSDAGSRIYTVVAEGYKDWPSGLNDTVTLSGWTTDGNHTMTIRSAAGQGHTGKLKDAGNYTGFALSPNNSISGTSNTRIERVIADGGTVYVGPYGSINRVLCSMNGGWIQAAQGGTVANSVGQTIAYSGWNYPNFVQCSFYHCTAAQFAAPVDTRFTQENVRFVNCLAISPTGGFLPSGNNYVHHCASVDGTATEADAWGHGEYNTVNQTVAFVDAANGDHHLSDTDIGARGRGVIGLGADAGGNPRNGPLYDVGALQNQTTITDANSDGIPDGWQVQYFTTITNPNAAPGADPDTDGYTNLQEYRGGMNPTNSNLVVPKPVAENVSVSMARNTPASIRFRASGGNSSAYTYQVMSGPTYGTLTGTGAYRTYTPNEGYSGSDAVTYKVNDGTADSNIATVTITVDGSRYITINPSSVTIPVTNNITLQVLDQGGASPVAGVAWRMSSGSGCTLTPALSYSGYGTDCILRSGPTAGGPFILTARYDGCVATATVIVQPTPPVVEAGLPQSVWPPASSATLTGSGSVDVVSWTWTQVSGPASTIVSPASDVTQVTGLSVPGTYVYRLTASNAGGGIASDDALVLVRAQGGAALRVCGSGWSGQLGNGTWISTNLPVDVLLLDAASIAASRSHSIAAKSDGTVWTWGENDYGELGDNTIVNRNIPVHVSSLSNITAVAAGAYHCMALKSDGTVWAWGARWGGALGDGTSNDRRIPVQVINLDSVTTIAGGYSYSLATRSDGTVWAWGANYYGTLGQGGVDYSDHPWPAQVSGLTGVKAVAGGTMHVIAVTFDGKVWTWGGNNYGQLGDGTFADHYTPAQVSTLSDVTAVAAGDNHSMALRSDGTVWAWGYNDSGQLGNNTSATSSTPVQVSGLTDVIRLAAGNSHSLALKSDGTVWAWGNNSYGQLGNTSCWQSLTPVQVDGLTDIMVTNVAAAYYHSLYLGTNIGSHALSLTVAISSPPDRSYTTNATVGVSGTALSGAGVTGVTVNGTGTATSNGYTNWTAAVTLSTGGTNLLVATATDAGGSAAVTSRVIYADEVFSTKNDGTPDRWKIQNWGTGFATNPASDASADPDADGFDNGAEFKAGTLPLDWHSRLFIDNMAPLGIDFSVQWVTVSGKYYLVQYSSNLLNWLDAGSSNRATSSVSEWVDDGSLTGGIPPGQAGRRYYRIKLP